MFAEGPIRNKKAVAFEPDQGQEPSYSLETIQCPDSWIEELVINSDSGVLTGKADETGFCEVEVSAESGEHIITHTFTIRIF